MSFGNASAVVTGVSEAGTSVPDLSSAAAAAFDGKKGADGSVPVDELSELLGGLGIVNGSEMAPFMKAQRVVKLAEIPGGVSREQYACLVSALTEWQAEVPPVVTDASLSESLTAKLQVPRSWRRTHARTLVCMHTPSLTHPVAGRSSYAPWCRLQGFFQQLDRDGDKQVTLEEATSHWGKNFARLNASAMFNEVDTDGDGTHSRERLPGRWLEPWRTALTCGTNPLASGPARPCERGQTRNSPQPGATSWR